MNQQPVYIFATWRVKEGQLDTVLNMIADVVTKSTAEEGNLFYNVHQKKEDSNTLVLYEGYADETALTAHRNSEHFQTIVAGQIIPLLETREVIVATRLMPG